MDGINTNDRISINFSERDNRLSNEAVQIAKDGGKSNIKIMDASGAAFVLKEIGSATASGIMGNLYPFDDSQADRSSAMAEAMSENADTANRITEKDSEELEEGGMNIERYNSERLERLLETRKAMTELVEKGIEGLKTELRENRDTARQVGRKIAVEKKAGKGLEIIAERLETANLPVTESNVSRIAESMAMSEEAQYMTEASFSYLVDNKLQPTIENCYVAVHSGRGGKRIVTDRAFEELKPSIDKIAGDAGLEINSELEQNARKLLEGGIAVSAENLTYYSELKELKTALAEGIIDENTVLDGAVESLKKRMAPKQTNLYTLLKREQVRLEMTGASAEQMRALGIEPDLEAISRRIDELKAMEREASKAILADTPEYDEKIALYEETLDAAAESEKAKDSLAAVSFASRRSISFRELSTVAVSINRGARARKAEASYEAAATEVRRDLGDSLGKAFAGIDSMLENMQLESTEANRRAVRMLAYANIEINESNINEMKYYDSEIQTLVDNLKPQVTAELIKRGINPLESTVRELSEKAAQVGRELGTSPEERFSEYLVKLERHRSITAEQRESYIGIYRMLYAIEKSDGAAISALVKSGRELTLGNLLTEVRSRRRGRLDKKVDDEFGAAESLTKSEKDIDVQIRAAYITGQVEKVAEKASPERLEAAESSLAKQAKSLMTATTESLAELLEGIDEGYEDSAYRSERLDDLRQTLTEADAESKMLKSFELEDSLVNLTAAKQLLAGYNPYERLEGIKKEKLKTDTESSAKTESLSELPETEQELVGQLTGIRMKLTELVEQIYLQADLSGREAMQLRSIGHYAELAGMLAKKEFYDIPMEDGEGITNIHLTLVHESAARGRFLVTLPESGLRAEGCLADGELNLLISAEDRADSEAVKQKNEDLKDRLKGLGFKAVKLFTEHGSGRSKYLDNAARKEKADTALLYKAAKEAVIFLRGIETEKQADNQAN